MDDRLPFRVELTVLSEDRALVVLEGEVDIYTSPDFGGALLEGIDHGARHVIVDLTRVPFIDSTAISVLVDGINRLRLADGAIDVVCSSNVRRVLEIAGLDRVVGVFATRDDALGDCTSGAAGGETP